MGALPLHASRGYTGLRVTHARCRKTVPSFDKTFCCVRNRNIHGNGRQTAYQVQNSWLVFLRKAILLTKVDEYFACKFVLLLRLSAKSVIVTQVDESQDAEPDWLAGTKDGKSGWFPANYVEKIKPQGGLLWHTRFILANGVAMASSVGKVPKRIVSLRNNMPLNRLRDDLIQLTVRIDKDSRCHR